MKHPFRSCLTVGVATITATVIAFSPPVEEPASTVPRVAPPAVQLTAQVQPLAVTDLPNLLVGWVQRFAVPPSAGQPVPTPDFPPVVSGTGIDSTIKNIYNAIEPWVQYGFELATYAVGWIPYVGWLSGQIMIFYHFGERIVRSITFNIADWLGGNVSFVQGLINVGVDTVNSFIQLGIDEWNFWLPPLPPLPPFPFAASATAATPTTASVVNDAELAEALDDTAAVDSEVTVKRQKKSDVDVVEPTGVAAQGEVRGAADDETTESAPVPKRGKKSQPDSTADSATASSTDTSATNDNKGDEKADKKDGVGKKE